MAETEKGLETANSEWWIPPEKQYRPETKRWYCECCRKITPIERNTEWSGDYKGKKPAPDWFARCKVCKKQHWQSSGFECPNCGWDEADEVSMIECGEPQLAQWAAMEFGGNPMNWEETHKCPKCKTIFTFKNSNY